MKKYKTYKDSGVEWIGEIPEHWGKARLNYLTERIGDGIHSTPKYTDGTEYKFINGNNLNDGKIIISPNTKSVSYEEFLKHHIDLNENTILLSINGTIGNLAFFNSEKVILGKSACYINCNEDILKYFIFYLLQSNEIKEYFSFELTGTTIYNLSLNSIRKTPIPLPPLTEQKSIAQYLDQKTTIIDTLLEKTKQKITTLQEQRTAIINQAVTKGLTHLPPAKGGTKGVKLKDSGVEWIGEIPENWKISRFKYVGNFINGYAFKSNSFTEEGVRVLKIANIQTMRIDWSDESFVGYEFYNDLPNFRVNKGDLVFALTRPIISTGIKAAIFDTEEKVLINQRNAVLKPKKMVLTKWLYYIILDNNFVQEFEKQIDNTGQQPNISSYEIGTIFLPIPNKNEQKKIIDFLNQKTTQLDHLIQKEQQRIDLLKEYRQSLISEVVTGKRCVLNEIPVA